MATPRTIEVSVRRKVTTNYNSTEYLAGVTLELTDAEAKIPNKVPALIEEWAEKLRASIRREFANGKATPDGHTAAPAPQAAKIGANGHAY